MIARQINPISISISTHTSGKIILTQEMLLDEVRTTLVELLNTYSYAELAKMMNMSPNTLHKIASGCRHNLKMDTVLKILQMGDKNLVIVGGSIE